MSHCAPGPGNRLSRAFARRQMAGLLVVVLVLAAALAGSAQSSRPGWGATPYHDSLGTGVTFRCWAPNATNVYLAGQFNSWSTSNTRLVQESTNGTLDGTWSLDVSGVATGSQYKYYIAGAYKNDPRAREVTQAGTGGNSIVYGPTNFNWNGDSLTPPALNDLFIYELHMGTFPPTATPNRFVAATNKLDYIKSLGVSAVELMPVAEFGNSGTSWGYDPAQIYAVDNAQYGGPDGLKTFIKACHARGLAVLLDVVHNHYGPGDLDMWDFDGYDGGGLGGGIYFYEGNSALQITPYANTRPNFSSNAVCSFIQDNFTMWVGEYHVDGFRWDTPNLMMHDNGNNYIPAAGNLMTAINAMLHTNYAGKISIAEDVYQSKGFDSAWDTDFPFSVTPVLAESADSNRDMTVIANAVQYNVRYGGTASQSRVAFLESHDVVGDLNGGSRLVTAIDSAAPSSYKARKLSTLGAAVTFMCPGVPMLFQGQEMLENQAFDSGLLVDWTKTNTYSGIVRLYTDLIKTRRNLYGVTPGLEGNECNVFQVDNNNKLVAFSRWNSTAPSQVAVVIANFANATRANYGLTFPSAGAWYVHFNSDSTNYSSDFGNGGSTVAIASGNPAKANITIAPYSALILSQLSPQLAMTHSNGLVTVSWLNNFSGWVLDSAPSLSGTPAWTQVPAAQYLTNGTSVFITNTPSAAATFYRLRQP